MTFMRGVLVAAFLWVSWVSIALYVSATRALPDAPAIQLAAARDPWCSFTPGGPLVDKPRHNYDYKVGTKYVGSTA